MNDKEFLEILDLCAKGDVHYCAECSIDQKLKDDCQCMNAVVKYARSYIHRKSNLIAKFNVGDIAYSVEQVGILKEHSTTFRYEIFPLTIKKVYVGKKQVTYYTSHRGRMYAERELCSTREEAQERMKLLEGKAKK